MKQHILITGTSTGIGQATARLLSQKGYIVYAGVRRLADAKPIAHPNLRPLLIDVTNVESVDAALGQLTHEVGNAGLHAVINNAGIIYNGPFELADEAELRRVMEVNFFGLARISQKSIGLLQTGYAASGRRSKLVFTSSIGGALGIPWEFAYHASKFAVNGLAESISYELAPLGIDVTSVMPGGIKTPIFDKGLQSASSFLGSERMGRNHDYYAANLGAFAKLAGQMYKAASTPEKAAAAFLKIIEASRAPSRVRIGMDAKVLYLLVRLLPISWRQALLGGQFVPHSKIPMATASAQPRVAEVI